jgi:hypothetical protein
MTSGDRFHAILEEELLLLETLFFDFLVFGEPRLRGENLQAVLVVAMFVVKPTVLRIQIWQGLRMIGLHSIRPPFRFSRGEEGGPSHDVESNGAMRGFQQS